jgi:glycerol-3-phosphate acyltransferase PlsY
MQTILQISCIILSYLIGAVPFGLFLGKIFSNIDVRSVGSGNIGATNVLRAAGKKAAVFTLLLDCLKGVLPVLAVKLLLQDDAITCLAGAAAVLGHNYPVYLAFKGGKGVATSFGVTLAVVPWIGLICLTTWLIIALIWRYSSLSALVAFALFPVFAFTAYRESRPVALLSLFVFGMIYYRHRENIKRLIAGMEPKIGQK